MRDYSKVNGQFWTGKTGKALRADYIAYAIKPAGRCYMLPVIQLQIAWSVYGEAWKRKFRNVPAKNNGYTTHSVAVPVNELFAEIGRALRVPFSAMEVA